MIRFREIEPSAPGVPHTWEIEQGGDMPLPDVLAWLREHAREIDARVLGGSLLIRGLDALASAEDFSRAVDALGAESMDYVGGTSPRSRVHGNIMVATELPPEFSIPLHQEMSYTSTFPARVSFFCQRPPARGGATTLCDMRALTDSIDPDLREKFERKGGVQLRRILPTPENRHKKPGVAKPWPEVFETDDPKVADRIAADRGWRVTWQDDGSLQHWQEVCPAIREHPVTGARVWFNQIHMYNPVASLTWARRDGRAEAAGMIERAMNEAPEMLDRIFHGDGDEVDDDESVYIFDLLERHAVDHHWRRGDVVIMDNILTAHGRRAFDGERSILTALIKASAEARRAS